MRSSDARKNIFTTPLQNDFQWYNLYRKMYGVCTYAPPIPMNPSTTTTTFPKRKHIEGFFDDYRPSFEMDRCGDDTYDDGERTFNPLLKRDSIENGIILSGRNVESNSGETSPMLMSQDDLFKRSTGEGSIQNLSMQSSNASLPHYKQKGSVRVGSAFANSEHDMLNELLDDCGFDEGLFNSNFFDFLKHGHTHSRKGSRSFEDPSVLENTTVGLSGNICQGQKKVAQTTEDTRSTSSWLPAIHASGTYLEPRQKPFHRTAEGVFSSPDGALSFSAIPSHASHPSLASTSSGTVNTKHSATDKVLLLQRETWALLMDNRALAWVEREAQETGKAAAQSLRRLLEIVTGPLTLPSKWFELKGVHMPRRSDLARGDEASGPPRLHGNDEANALALQRVYESFSPFFSVISTPKVLQQLQNDYNAALRAQIRGLPGQAADLVGMPLFSQYATWKEAFENRKAWNNAPFSYFLIHDPSFHYAQICALFSLLQIVQDESHQHTERCLEAAGSVVALEAASYLLIDSKGIRMAAEDHLHICPLLAIQETTEDVLLAYEQSSARNALTMILHVCDFVTDCVLDPETAVNFVSSHALKLHSTFQVPGTELRYGALGLSNSKGHATSREKTERGSCDHNNSRSNAPDKDEVNHVSQDSASVSADPSISLQESKSQKGEEAPVTKRIQLLPRRFDEADFESLFNLIYWFTDAATVHSKVPVDPLLLPRQLDAEPNMLGAPSGTKKFGKELNLPDWIPMEVSITSLESVDMSVGSHKQALRKKRRAPMPTTTKLVKNTKGSAAPAGRPWNRNQPFATAEGRTTSILVSSPEREKSAPIEPLYIPGRHQRYHAVSSLLEAITSYEACLQTLLNHNQRVEQEALENKKIALHSDSVRPTKILYPASTEHDEGSVVRRRRRRSSVKTKGFTDLSGFGAYFSSSTTLLKMPLLLVMSYIRLHGASWLKQLFERLFNILRKESVLLYVNTLDLASEFNDPDVKQERRTLGGINFPPPSSRSGSILNTLHHSDTSPGNENSFSRVSSLANAESFSLGAPRGMSRNMHVQSLEDLICQDILYVMNEFFNALYGTRSTTRLPRGITALLTQFTTTVHLHLLESLVDPNILDAGVGVESANSVPVDSARAGLRRVSEYLRHLKLSQVAIRKGMLRHNEALTSSPVKRLFNNIEQNRLAKFILFDCWIICTLNNAISYGHLDENASLHLRWNIDAFARYLKILVNAPFIKDKASSGYAAEASRYINSLAEYVPSGQDVNFFPVNPSTDLRDRPRGNITKRQSLGGTGKFSQVDGLSFRGSLNTKQEKQPPVTMSLPCFITGIYDIATGNLVRLGRHTHSLSSDTRPVSREESIRTVLSFSRGLKGNKSSSSRRNSMQTPSGQTATADNRYTLRRRNSFASQSFALSHIDGSTSPAASPQIYTFVEGSNWENISPHMKALNEALGIVGYDVEEDTFGEEKSSHALGSNPHERVDLLMAMSELEKGNFTEQICAMRLLDCFTRMASHELSRNVVMSEFEVLPSIAARCVDKLTDFITGQHPLIVNAASLGVLPNTFNFSPYLASLHGTLLHPKCAAQALDNVSRNSRRFYDALIRPLKDGTILQLIAGMTLDQKGLPIVDTNAILSLLQTNTSEATGSPGVLRTTPDVRALRGPLTNHRQPRLSHFSLAQQWEAEARRLRQQHAFLTTGSMYQTALTKKLRLNAKQLDPMHFLKAGADAIVQEAHVMPLCFDPWWRIMVVALCFKLTTLLSECSSLQAESFFAKCQEKLAVFKEGDRKATKNFIAQLGKGTEGIATEPKKKRAAEAPGKKAHLKSGQRRGIEGNKSRTPAPRK